MMPSTDSVAGGIMERAGFSAITPATGWGCGSTVWSSRGAVVSPSSGATPRSGATSSPGARLIP